MSSNVFALILDAPGASGTGRNKLLLVCDAYDGPIIALPCRVKENPADVIAEYLPPVPVMPLPIKCTWQQRLALLSEYGPGKRPELLAKYKVRA